MPDDRQREMHGFRGTLISGYTEAHSFDVAKKRLSKEGERQAKGQVKKKSDSNGSTNTNLGGESDGKRGVSHFVCDGHPATEEIADELKDPLFVMH